MMIYNYLTDRAGKKSTNKRTANGENRGLWDNENDEANTVPAPHPTKASYAYHNLPKIRRPIDLTEITVAIKKPKLLDNVQITATKTLPRSHMPPKSNMPPNDNTIPKSDYKSKFPNKHRNNDIYPQPHLTIQNSNKKATKIFIIIFLLLIVSTTVFYFYYEFSKTS